MYQNTFYPSRQLETKTGIEESVDVQMVGGLPCSIKGKPGLSDAMNLRKMLGECMVRA